MKDVLVDGSSAFIGWIDSVEQVESGWFEEEVDAADTKLVYLKAGFLAGGSSSFIGWDFTKQYRHRQENWHSGEKYAFIENSTIFVQWLWDYVKMTH